MADQQQHQQAALQHLAYLRQHQPRLPTVGGHNPWAAEAGLEAHLQHQRALVAVQDLERQRVQK